MTSPRTLPRTATTAAAALSVCPTEVPLHCGLDLTLTLQSPDALVTVLTTVARLGCRLTRGVAVGVRAVLGVLAPTRIAHRIAPLLEQLVEVLDVADTEEV
jgi:hypothetical protein